MFIPFDKGLDMLEFTTIDSHDHYQSIFENANDGILIADPHNLQIMDANRKIIEMYGYSREELNTKKIYQVYPSHIAKEVCKKIRRLTKKKDLVVRETSQLRKDGKKLFIEISFSLINYGDKSLVLAIHRDITKRKNLETRYRQSAEKYRDLVQNSLDGIFIVRKGVILFSNPEFQKIMGFRKEALFRKPIEDLIDPEESDFIIRMMQKCEHEREGTRRYEFKALRKDGKKIDVEMTFSYIEYLGKGAVQGSIRDITERKRLEEEYVQRERLAALGEMTSEIAHEIRNPLVSIGGFARIIDRNLDAGGNNKKHIARIIREVRHLEDILSALLIYVRAGRMEFRSTDVNKVIEGVLNSLSLELKNGRVEVELHLDTMLEPIRIDEDQICQVLISLLRNSTQAMQEGGKVRIHTRRRWKYLEIEISDSGDGIEKKHMKRIFEPFFTTKTKGMGLGLAISKKIIDGHQGKIYIRSESERGATFLIDLPYA